MSESKTNSPGTFCWVELGTTNLDAAKVFYSELFGWATDEVPAGDFGTYCMLKLEDKEVGGAYTLGEEQQKQGIPPHWMSYVAVESADAAAEKAQSLGATVFMAPMDVMDVGRMSILQDPAGAVFAVWEPKEHCGFGLRDAPSTPCWFELLTRDVAKAGRFYTELFSWTTDVMEMPEGNYTVFKQGETQVGGMMAMPPNVPAQAPPHWMAYFMVESCDSTTERLGTLGGNALVPPQDIPNVGRFSVVTDPQGAAFALFQGAEPA